MRPVGDGSRGSRHYPIRRGSGWGRGGGGGGAPGRGRDWEAHEDPRPHHHHHPSSSSRSSRPRQRSGTPDHSPRRPRRDRSRGGSSSRTSLQQQQPEGPAERREHSRPRRSPSPYSPPPRPSATSASASRREVVVTPPPVGLSSPYPFSSDIFPIPPTTTTTTTGARLEPLLGLASRIRGYSIPARSPSPTPSVAVAVFQNPPAPPRPAIPAATPAIAVGNRKICPPPPILGSLNRSGRRPRSRSITPPRRRSPSHSRGRNRSPPHRERGRHYSPPPHCRRQLGWHPSKSPPTRSRRPHHHHHHRRSIESPSPPPPKYKPYPRRCPSTVVVSDRDSGFGDGEGRRRDPPSQAKIRFRLGERRQENEERSHHQPNLVRRAPPRSPPSETISRPPPSRFIGRYSSPGPRFNFKFNNKFKNFKKGNYFKKRYPTPTYKNRERGTMQNGGGWEEEEPSWEDDNESQEDTGGKGDYQDKKGYAADDAEGYDDEVPSTKPNVFGRTPGNIVGWGSGSGNERPGGSSSTSYAFPGPGTQPPSTTAQPPEDIQSSKNIEFVSGGVIQDEPPPPEAIHKVKVVIESSTQSDEHQRSEVEVAVSVIPESDHHQEPNNMASDPVEPTPPPPQGENQGDMDMGEKEAPDLLITPDAEAGDTSSGSVAVDMFSPSLHDNPSSSIESAASAQENGNNGSSSPPPLELKKLLATDQDYLAIWRAMCEMGEGDESDPTTREILTLHRGEEELPKTQDPDISTSTPPPSSSSLSPSIIGAQPQTSAPASTENDLGVEATPSSPSPEIIEISFPDNEQPLLPVGASNVPAPDLPTKAKKPRKKRTRMKEIPTGVAYAAAASGSSVPPRATWIPAPGSSTSSSSSSLGFATAPIPDHRQYNYSLITAELNRRMTMVEASYSPANNGGLKKGHWQQLQPHQYQKPAQQQPKPRGRPKAAAPNRPPTTSLHFFPSAPAAASSKNLNGEFGVLSLEQRCPSQSTHYNVAPSNTNVNELAALVPQPKKKIQRRKQSIQQQWTPVTPPPIMLSPCSVANEAYLRHRQQQELEQLQQLQAQSQLRQQQQSLFRIHSNLSLSQRLTTPPYSMPSMLLTQTIINASNRLPPKPSRQPKRGRPPKKAPPSAALGKAPPISTPCNGNDNGSLVTPQPSPPGHHHHPPPDLVDPLQFVVTCYDEPVQVWNGCDFDDFQAKAQKVWKPRAKRQNKKASQEGSSPPPPGFLHGLKTAAELLGLPMPPKRRRGRPARPRPVEQIQQQAQAVPVPPPPQGGVGGGVQQGQNQVVQAAPAAPQQNPTWLSRGPIKYLLGKYYNNAGNY